MFSDRKGVGKTASQFVSGSGRYEMAWRTGIEKFWPPVQSD